MGGLEARPRKNWHDTIFQRRQSSIALLGAVELYSLDIIPSKSGINVKHTYLRRKGVLSAFCACQTRHFFY